MRQPLDVVQVPIGADHVRAVFHWLRKLFTGGVVFKGTGFYRTDSRESGKKSKSQTNGSSTSESTKSSGVLGVLARVKARLRVNREVNQLHNRRRGRLS